MRSIQKFLVILSIAGGGVGAQAASLYVAQNGQTPGDFLSWTAAASNIQDAVNAASAGDTVWVGDGVYRAPANGVAYNNVTNIVYMNKPLTLCGFSGVPAGVIIDGEGIYRGINVYYNTSTTNRFAVMGLTVSNSYDRGILFYATADAISWTGVVANCAVVDGKNGGGIYDNHYDSGRTISVSNTVVRNNQGAGITVYSTIGTHNPSSLITDSIIEGNTNSGLSFHNGTHAISRCIIRGNTSPVSSGGLTMGAGTYSMDNCLVYNNVAAGIGGGIYKWSATGALFVNNCTIVSNLSTVTGPGGIRSSATNPIVNSIIYRNFYNSTEQNIYSTTLTTLTNCLSPGYSGSGNISVPAPAFENAAAGDYRLKNFSSGVDAGMTQEWMSAATDLAGQPRVSANGLVDMGAYETTYAPHPGYYAAQNGQTPVSPYTNWPTAASNIQEAVSVFDTNYARTVWVGAGHYFAPAVVPDYYGPTVVVIDKPLTLRSSNSVPYSTIIDGGGIMRGVAVKNGAATRTVYVIDGFTIINGYATNIGGGIVAASGTFAMTTVVQNCTIEGNTAFSSGGGLCANNTACDLTISNCTIRGNVATNANPFNPANNIGGGGVYVNCRTLITDCIVSSNCWGTATNNSNNGGGGIYLHPNPNHMIRNTLISGNSGYGNGGGIYMWVASGVPQSLHVLNLINSTLVGNPIGFGIYMRRVNCTINVLNSILYTNAYQNIAASVGPQTSITNLFMYYSCISPTNGIVGVLDASNTTNNPQFANYAASDFRLAPNSPCINAGSNDTWMIGALDVGDNPRISPMTSGTVDMGAYEFPIQSGSVFTVR